MELNQCRCGNEVDWCDVCAHGPLDERMSYSVHRARKAHHGIPAGKVYARVVWRRFYVRGPTVEVLTLHVRALPHQVRRSCWMLVNISGVDFGPAKCCNPARARALYKEERPS